MMNKSLKKTFVMLALSSVCLSSWAEEPKSFEVHTTKMDLSVENCPKAEMELAQEILELELAGMRYLKSKPACFNNLKVKYVHSAKNPDEAVDSLVEVVGDSYKIESLEYDEKFFSFKAVFSVKNKGGKTVRDSFSFMTSAKPGAKKPGRGCALISSSPSKAYVKQACL